MANQIRAWQRSQGAKQHLAVLRASEAPGDGG